MQKVAAETSFERRSIKGTNRIQVNNLFAAISLAVLTILLQGGQEVNTLIVVQLALAIPLLATSTLSYEKVAYLNSAKRWDTLGWWTHSFGYLLIMNAIAIILCVRESQTLALLFSGVLIALHVATLVVSVKTDVSTHNRKKSISRFVVYVVIILMGSVLPILMGLSRYPVVNDNP